MFLVNCASGSNERKHVLCAYACYRKPRLLLLHRQRLLHSKYCSILAPFHKSDTPPKKQDASLHGSPSNTRSSRHTCTSAHFSQALSLDHCTSHTPPQAGHLRGSGWTCEEGSVSHSYTSTQRQNNSRGQQVARWRLSGRFPPPARTWRGPPVADDAPLQQPGDFSDVSPVGAASYTLPPSSPGTAPRGR